MEMTSPDDFEEYISSIVDWGKTVDCQYTKALISSAMLDAIDEDDAFPWQDKIKSALKHYRIKSVDSETVSSVIQYFLNCSHIEDSVGIEEMLLDDNKTEIVPAFVCERLRSRTRTAFCELLAMIALVQNGYSHDIEQIALASIPHHNAEPNLQYLSFTAQIEDIEWKINSDNVIVDRPYAIIDRITVFFSRNGLLESFEPLSLWPASNDPGAAQNAIDCCMARLIAAGTSETNRKEYIIGGNFLTTVQKWGCGPEGAHTFTLIESCARIILNIPKHEIKEFFNNSNNCQQTRNDGAQAFRTHLTKRGAGLRLMFWKLPTGIIEFANVGDKDELIIL